MNGYILLHRKLVDWEWYTDVNTKCLFLHLLLYANHKDTNWRGETIPRGGLITSYATLSSQTGLSIQQIRTALKNLEKTGEVTRKSSNKNTLIIVTNYALYQRFEQQDNVLDNNQITRKQQSSNNQSTTYNTHNTHNTLNKEYIVFVIDFLNETLGTHYSYKNKQYNELINARLNEGFTVDDFITVIKKKFDEWNGTDMEKYLTPSTLFRASNFEKYLNQKISTKKDLPNWYAQTESSKPDEHLLKEALELQSQLKGVS